MVLILHQIKTPITQAFLQLRLDLVVLRWGLKRVFTGKRVFPGVFFLGVHFLQFNPLALFGDVFAVAGLSLLQPFLLAPSFSLVPFDLPKKQIFGYFFRILFMYV
jgi:hypothetical protein